MKSIIPITNILFYVLPFLINGERFSSQFPKEVAELNELAEKRSTINNVLRLKSDGFLGDGGFGFVYEGVYLEDNRPVAIKFSTSNRRAVCQREFEMYNYLKAYKNASVERYGIPVIYYYGRWNKFIVTAMTKLDKDLVDIANDWHELRKPLDVLLLIRNFIFQSKYMHSCGVRHDDIKPENIMTRGYKSFLIDYNLSSKMAEDNEQGTPYYAARRFHKEEKETRRPIDDWESFFYSLLHVKRVPLDWFVSSSFNLYCNMFENHYLKSCKKKTDRIRDLISKYVSDDVLKMVLIEIANEIYSYGQTKAFPNYNRLEKLVSVEIGKKYRKDVNIPPMFSWLTKAEIQEAIDEINSNPPLKIEDITEPSSINFNKFNYPEVEQLLPLDTDELPSKSEKSVLRQLVQKSIKKVCFIPQPSE